MCKAFRTNNYQQALLNTRPGRLGAGRLPIAGRARHKAGPAVRFGFVGANWLTDSAILAAEAAIRGPSSDVANAAVPRKGAASRPLGCRSDEGHGDVARILRLAFVRPQPTPGAQRALRTLTCTKTHALLQVARTAPLRRCLARTDFLSVGEWLVAGVLAPALAGQRPRHQPKCSAPANKMDTRQHESAFARAFLVPDDTISQQAFVSRAVARK